MYFPCLTPSAIIAVKGEPLTLPMENFNNAEWIRRKWVEMFLKKCASEVREARKKATRGSKRRATDLGERAGNNARGNVSELPNTTFIIVIRRVLNGNNDPTPSTQFQSSYTDVRHWEELIEFIEKNCGPKEPYCLTALYKSTVRGSPLIVTMTQDGWSVVCLLAGVHTSHVSIE